MRLAPKEQRQTRTGKAVAFTKGTKFLKVKGSTAVQDSNPKCT